MDSFPLMNWVKSWTTLRQFERLTVSPLVIHLNTVREHCNLFDLQNIIILVQIIQILVGFSWDVLSFSNPLPPLPALLVCTVFSV